MAGIGLALCAQTGAAAEITVLSAGAIEPGLKAAVAAFQKETGHEVRVTFNVVGEIDLREIDAGATRVAARVRVLHGPGPVGVRPVGEDRQGFRGP